MGDTVEVEVGARLVTHFTKVCFKTVMWDSQQGGGGVSAALKHLNIVSHPSIHATPRCSVGGGEVHLMFSVPSGLMCPNKGG